MSAMADFMLAMEEVQTQLVEMLAQNTPTWISEACTVHLSDTTDAERFQPCLYVSTPSMVGGSLELIPLIPRDFRKHREIRRWSVRFSRGDASICVSFSAKIETVLVMVQRICDGDRVFDVCTPTCKQIIRDRQS